MKRRGQRGVNIMRITAFFLLSCLLLGASDLFAEEDPVFLSYASSACAGDCPVFSIEVHESGKVVFEGVAYVPEPGTRIFQLIRPDLEAVKHLLDRRQILLEPARNCSNFDIEAPRYYLTVHLGNIDVESVFYPDCYMEERYVLVRALEALEASLLPWGIVPANRDF